MPVLWQNLWQTINVNVVLFDKLAEEALLLGLILDFVLGINRLERLLEVNENIVDMLGADGESDGVGLDTLLKQLVARQLRVRC